MAGWHLSDYFHCQFKWQCWRNPICVLSSLGKRQGTCSVCECAASVMCWFLNIFFPDINFVHFSPPDQNKLLRNALSLELAPGFISIVTSLWHHLQRKELTRWPSFKNSGSTWAHVCHLCYRTYGSILLEELKWRDAKSGNTTKQPVPRYPSSRLEILQGLLSAPPWPLCQLKLAEPLNMPLNTVFKLGVWD